MHNLQLLEDSRTTTATQYGISYVTFNEAFYMSLCRKGQVKAMSRAMASLLFLWDVRNLSISLAIT